MKTHIDFWPKNPKPNFQNAQMNVTSAKITSYRLPIYKTKPNKPNLVHRSLGEGGFKPNLS